MIQMAYEDMITKVMNESGIDKEELLKRIDNKMGQLAGLISKEGAIHIVANELGVKLFDNLTGKMKINAILAGMRSLEIIGKVVQVYELKNFVSKDREGKLLSFVIGDETGTIRIVAWGIKADECLKLKLGDIISIKNAISKENQGRKEIHLGDRSDININPSGEKDIIVQKKENIKRNISDLKENEDVEILGTIIQVFEPKFFEVCPECNKRLKIKDVEFSCELHGKVEPGYSYLINFSIDDGTGITRCVCFRQQASALLGMTHSQMIQLKNNLESFKDIQTKMLGIIARIEGKVSKNVMFDRIEIIVNNINLEPDPANEIKRLTDEINNIKISM